MKMKVMLMMTTPATMQRTNNGPERKQTTLSFELSQQIRSRCSVSAQLIGSTSNMRTIENILAFQTDPSKWAKAAEKFEPPARKEEEPVELPPEVGSSETGGI